MFHSCGGIYTHTSIYIYCCIIKPLIVFKSIYILFMFIIGITNGITNGEKNEKLLDQTTVALETYYCVNFHVLSDHLS